MCQGQRGPGQQRADLKTQEGNGGVEEAAWDAEGGERIKHVGGDESMY